MKTKSILCSLVTTLGISILLPPAGHAAQDAGAPETAEHRDARMAWWRQAKFGMFIHWGVYSVPAGFYKGKPVPGIGEWIMNRGKIPMAEYQAFAKEFNPVKFNADEWVKIAREAGVKYIVITTKHHDGFAMFKTAASKWNICDATPFGRDPIKELAEACRKQGIKLGFYYSQAQDWNNGGSAMVKGPKWDPAMEHDMDDYIDKIAVPQVREILSNYGKDIPAVLWWDTPAGMNKDRASKFYNLVQELKPEVIMNNRLGGGFQGDTETPEQFIPANGFQGRDWETCMTMNNTWGFKRDDHQWKSTEKLIRNLCDIASKGGNFLLNVGPDAEGNIPEPSIERLRQVGVWLKTNGEAIYGTKASPFPTVDSLPWGRATQKAGKLYLHVFDWPKDGKLVVPIENHVAKAWLLAKPNEALALSMDAGKGTIISVPMAAPDPVASVVALELNEAPKPLPSSPAKSQLAPVSK